MEISAIPRASNSETLEMTEQPEKGTLYSLDWLKENLQEIVSIEK